MRLLVQDPHISSMAQKMRGFVGEAPVLGTLLLLLCKWCHSRAPLSGVFGGLVSTPCSVLDLLGRQGSPGYERNVISHGSHPEWSCPQGTPDHI